MYITELEKNLRTYLNNIPYDEKDTVRKHILALINENEGIPCVKTGVAKNYDDSYFCYIEATGFLAIGKQMHEIRILFPHNYPVAPPQFNILYKPDQYKVQNEAALVASKVIVFEKTPANQVLINIKCPALHACWSSEGRNAADAYRQVETWLNNPPLLTPKERLRERPIDKINQGQDPLRMSATWSCAERFVYDFQLRVLKIQEDVQKCEQGQTDVNFNLSRVEFFKRNLPKLQKSMKNFEQKVADKVNKLSEISEPIYLNRTCDSLLEMGETQKRKLQILGAREGLKEGQRKLIKAIQAQIRTKATKFSDYNNMIRKLSERMFQAQLNYLKLSD